jgi:putative phosphoesterase
MRLAFISDIHANLVALQTVLQDIDKEAVDQIICLGDIIDCGPQPEDVIRLLQDRNIECIAGNHDPLNEHPNNPQLREIEVWTEKQLSQESKDFLANLPSRRTLQVEQSKVLCVHGSPHRVTDQVLEDTPRETLESWTRNENFDIMVCGHTHVQALRNLDNKTLVNVGSVGMPFVRPLGPPPPRVIRRADYAILDCREHRVAVSFHRVPIDLDAFTQSLHVYNFPKPNKWLELWEP